MINIEADGVCCVEIEAALSLDLWGEIEPFVIRALEYDVYASTSTEKIKEQIRTGYARVLVCTSGDDVLSATIVQLQKNVKQERVLHVITTAGEASEGWLYVLIEGLKEIAESEECEAVTISGRPGWARKLRQYGFRTAQITMRLNSDGWIKQEQKLVTLVR